MADTIEQLDPNLIQPNPLQPRGLITQDSLSELIESIKEHGILEPLIVAKTPAGYQIIAGERRWRASKAIGLKEIPALIRETTTRGMLEMALVENVQREDLNPLERAQAFKRLMDEFGLTYKEIGQKISKSESYVSNSIRLLSLPDALKDGLLTGLISEGHARALVGLDQKTIIEAYKALLRDGGSVRRAEELARMYKEKTGVAPRHKKDKVYSEELVKMEKDMRDALAAKKVKVTQSAVAATITIYLRGDNEETTKTLKRIYSNLCPGIF
ncbi:MAG: ParB/RepB/Spo0J family partition protein [bacterium]|nr:ParB/RepB/Spo0J family partition protein [bacterium]